MHWSQIHEQGAFVLSAICKYNTMVVYAWFFRKKLFSVTLLEYANELVNLRQVSSAVLLIF
jgi:hypothetical protein